MAAGWSTTPEKVLDWLLGAGGLRHALLGLRKLLRACLAYSYDVDQLRDNAEEIAAKIDRIEQSFQTLDVQLRVGFGSDKRTENGSAMQGLYKELERLTQSSVELRQKHRAAERLLEVRTEELRASQSQQQMLRFELGRREESFCRLQNELNVLIGDQANICRDASVLRLHADLSTVVQQMQGKTVDGQTRSRSLDVVSKVQRHSSPPETARKHWSPSPSASKNFKGASRRVSPSTEQVRDPAEPRERLATSFPASNEDCFQGTSGNTDVPRKARLHKAFEPDIAPVVHDWLAKGDCHSRSRVSSAASDDQVQWRSRVSSADDEWGSDVTRSRSRGNSSSNLTLRNALRRRPDVDGSAGKVDADQESGSCSSSVNVSRNACGADLGHNKAPYENHMSPTVKYWLAVAEEDQQEAVGLSLRSVSNGVLSVSAVSDAGSPRAPWGVPRRRTSSADYAVVDHAKIEAERSRSLASECSPPSSPSQAPSREINRYCSPVRGRSALRDISSSEECSSMRTGSAPARWTVREMIANSSNPAESVVPPLTMPSLSRSSSSSGYKQVAAWTRTTSPPHVTLMYRQEYATGVTHSKMPRRQANCAVVRVVQSPPPNIPVKVSPNVVQHTAFKSPEPPQHMPHGSILPSQQPGSSGVLPAPSGIQPPAKPDVGKLRVPTKLEAPWLQLGSGVAELLNVDTADRPSSNSQLMQGASPGTLRLSSAGSLPTPIPVMRK